MSILNTIHEVLKVKKVGCYKNINKKTCKRKKTTTKITGIKFDQKKNLRRMKFEKKIKNDPK
jgi:hypothetical protein